MLMSTNDQHQSVHQALSHKTGRSLEEISLLAKAEGLLTHNEVAAWLKQEFEIEHGHATAISHLIMPDASTDAAGTDFYHWLSRADADWRPALEELASKVEHFGMDCTIMTYKHQLHLQRGGHEFARLCVVAGRLQIDVALPGAPVRSGFQALDADDEPFTDRFSATVQQQISDELVSWLRQAYDRAI